MYRIYIIFLMLPMAVSTIATTATSSTDEPVPNTPSDFWWFPHVGPDVTFTFTVDGSVASCNVTVQGGDSQVNVTDTCESVHVTGLKNGRTYNLTVTAYRGTKASQPALLNFTTDETASQAVRDLTVIVSDSSLNVTWQKPEDINGILRCYGLIVRQESQCVQAIVYSAMDQSSNSKGCEINSEAIGKIENCTNRRMESGDIQKEKQEVTVTDLYPATNYNIIVFAINGAAENNGVGQLATWTATTRTAVPSNPTTFTAIAITENSVTLNWTSPDPYPGPTNYTLVITDRGSRYYNSHTDSPTSTLIPGYNNVTYTVRSLRPAWNYSFSLSAHTESGSSGNITTLISTNNSAPGAVQSLTVTPGQEAFKHLTARWRCPGVADRHSLIKGFLVKTTIVGQGPGCDISSSYTSPVVKSVTQADPTIHCNSSNCYVSLAENSCQGNQSVVIDVQPDTRYLIQVGSVGEEYNSSDWANTTYCSPAGSSEAVRNLNVAVLNESALHVTWEEPEKTNGMLHGYGVLVSDGSGCVQKIYLNNSANCETPIGKSKDPRIGTPCTNWSVICRQDLQLTITDLLPDTSYTITVFAINGAPQNNGWGSPSSFNRTTAIAVPSNINNFTAKWSTSTSVNLTWSLPVPRPGPTNYTLVTTDLGPLYYSYRGAFSTNKTLIPGYDSHEYLVKELRPAWNYSFTLSAQTSRGSSQTTTTTAQTQDSVPGVVQNLTVTPGQEAYKQQTASWRCPRVTERNTRIIGFLLNTTSWNINEGDKKEDSSAAQKNQCSVGICFVNVADVGCENIQSVDIVVKPENHYLIQVQTVGEKYNSTEWVDTTFDTPAGPSGPVEHLRAESVDGFSVSVEWSKPNETNGKLLGYVVHVLQSGLECVQMILYTSKSTDNTGQGCFDKGKIKCEEYDKHCANVTNLSGDIDNPNPNIIVAHLLPDTWYTFIVFAVNGAEQNNGAGEAASTNTTTNITVPSNLKDFTATTITKDSINLTWTPPEPRPGPTNYTLVVTDLGSRYYPHSKMDWTNVTHITGYESKHFTVTGLRPAWNYSFSLSAQTVKGSSKNITMTLFTNDSVPGVVQNLNVTPGQVAYKQLTASWRCPGVTDRHTLIRGFLINTTLEGCSGGEVIGCKDKESLSYTMVDSQTKSCDIGLCFLNLTDNCDGNETVTIVVRPESRHLIQVLTVGENFNSTGWVNTTYDAPAGRSGKVENLNVNYLNESDVSVEWGYPTETNGLLLGYGLLVYNNGVCERSIWSPQSRKGYFKEKCAEGVYKPNKTCKETETRTSEPQKEDRTEVAISGLYPYTSYNITVFAVNCATDNNGEGEPDNINFVTNMSGPVRNLNVVALSDSALQVTWDKPEAVNGELRGYGLHVLTNDTKCVQAIKFTNDNTSCNKVGSEANEKLDHCANRTDICRDINSLRQEVNITDLLPDTLYTIIVFAINDAVQNRGEGQKVSRDGTTNIAAPSKITDFTAVFINNSVTLTWSPPQPRPGPTNYTLVITDLGSRYYQDRTMSSTSKTIYIQGYDITSHIEKYLRSAWNYSFCLSAHTVRGSSQNTSFTISTNDSAPTLTGDPEFGKSLLKEAAPSDVTQTSAVINICPCLVTDRSHGHITLAGLIVCKGNCETSSDANYFRSGVMTWKQFKDKGYEGSYRPTPDDWHETQHIGDQHSSVQTVSSRKKRSTFQSRSIRETLNKIQFTLGGDVNCEQKSESVYCNGPLPPDNTFVVKVFACTAGGCKLEDTGIVITTRGEEPVTNLGAIVGGVLGALAALVILVLIIVFVKRRRRRPTERIQKYVPSIKRLRHSINLRDFKSRLDLLHRDSNLHFQEEFEKLCSSQERQASQFAMRAGNEPVNRFKNRSQEALPYDHSRVVLINSQNSDYINASYIAGADSPCEYIATQGPLYSTLSDFWRMVYEHRTGVIVMLCDSVENGKKMVDPYWPDEINVPVRHGELTVTMTGVSVLDAYAMRQIKVTMKDRQDLRVTQLCIRGWSERGCSLPVEKLIDVIRVAGREATKSSGPVTVHCNLGVGRTGMFIALDLLTRFVDNHALNQEVNVYDVVQRMMGCRPNIIQTLTQYMFIHDVLGVILIKKTQNGSRGATSSVVYQNEGHTINEYNELHEHIRDEHVYSALNEHQMK